MANYTVIDQTIGMPPSTYISDAELLNSMPMVLISPQVPEVASGETLFRLTDASKAYLDIVHELGYHTDLPLKVAFQAEAFPVDTFSNDYTETFLQKFTDVASQGVQQLTQMTGKDNLSDALKALGQFTKTLGEGGGGYTQKAFNMVGSGVETIERELNAIHSSLQSSRSSDLNLLATAGTAMSKMMASHRVDYPKIWGNSAYSSNFSINIKLFNPRPGHTGDTNKYIIGPLALLLSLATPITGDGYSYNWPFFHVIDAPGFFKMDPGAITNITVTKGGDHQQVAFTKTLGMVDVRIDFMSLYDSLILENPKSPKKIRRPSVRNYLENLKINKNTNHRTGRKHLAESSQQLAGHIGGSGPVTRTPTPRNDSLEKSKEIILTKNLATAKMLPSTNLTSITEGVTGRVPAQLSAISSVNASLNKEFITANIPKVPDIAPF